MKATTQVLSTIIKSILPTGISLVNRFSFRVVDLNIYELIEGTMKERYKGK